MQMAFVDGNSMGGMGYMNVAARPAELVTGAFSLLLLHPNG